MVTSAGSCECAPASLPLLEPNKSALTSHQRLLAGSTSPVSSHLGVCSSVFRVTTGAMTRTWWPSLVLQTTATAVETRQPSWNWMTLWNTLCKLKKAAGRLKLVSSARVGGFLRFLSDLHVCFSLSAVGVNFSETSLFVINNSSLGSWLSSFFLFQPSVWSRPPPRRAPRDQTHSWLLPVNVQNCPCQSPRTPCPPRPRPTPPLSFGWKFLNLTVPGRIETNDWLKNQDFKEESLESDPPLQPPVSTLSSMLLGKNKDDLFVFFLFITCFENQIIKLPTWTKCAIFWSFYMCNTQCLSSFFLRPALNPPCLINTTHRIPFCCNIILRVQGEYICFK